MIKQCIVLRKDLKNTKGEKVRTGKLVAQGAHASIAWLTSRMQCCDSHKIAADSNVVPNRDHFLFNGLILSPDEVEWIEGSFTKVCLSVDSEAELLAVADKATQVGLECHVITDNGRTEFAEPTKTCLAIGPANAEAIDKITGHLRLY